MVRVGHFQQRGLSRARGRLLQETCCLLGEQPLVDCDVVDSGCNRELMNNAFASAEENDDPVWLELGVFDHEFPRK